MASSSSACHRACRTLLGRRCRARRRRPKPSRGRSDVYGTAASPVPTGLVIPPVPAVEPGYRAPAASVPNGEVVGVRSNRSSASHCRMPWRWRSSRNGDLTVSQQNRQIAGYQIVAAQGAYDLRFRIVPSYELSDPCVVDAVCSGPRRGTRHPDGARRRRRALPVRRSAATTYSVGFNGRRLPFDNTGNGYNPSTKARFRST